MEYSIKSFLAFSVILALFIVFAAQAESATLLKKRSIVRRDSSQPAAMCRSNNVCGWEVYDAYSRNREYYVSSSCKCVAEDHCIRMEDDISISAYVYRCRPRRVKNRNKTTTRPGGNTSNTTS